MSTEITKPKDNSIKALLNREDVKIRFQEMLGARSNQFLTSVMTAVQQNVNLSKADPTSIMFAAATAASMDLLVTPALGFAYLVPYNTKQEDGSMKQMCQFQIGYKGLIQLCQRTGMFAKINSVEVYEGQLISENPLRGNQYDWSAKSSDKVIGYVAFFELTNGYSHELYMTDQQVQKHAGRYSKTHKNKWGVWETNRNEMSIKTVLKLLLGKYAPMSIDYLQKAVITDQSIIKDWDGHEIEYPDSANEAIEKVDHEKVSAQKEIERLRKFLSETTDLNELEATEAMFIDQPEMAKMVTVRIAELKEINRLNQVKTDKKNV